VNVGKQPTIWHGILDEAVPDIRVKAIKKAVEAKLTTFDRHKDALLDHLRSLSDGSSKPFDADKVWRDLTRLAQGYYLRQTIPPAAKRAAGLRQFASALERARRYGERARQDDVGSDLFSAWFDGIPREPRGQIVVDDDGSLRALCLPELDLKQMLASIDVYQAAVLRAANNVPGTGPGKPTILPRGYIHELADVYRRSTRQEPGAGDGLFARFVHKFFTSMGRSKIGYESVIDAIKIARREHGRL
jgi:hypothetical protein